MRRFFTFSLAFHLLGLTASGAHGPQDCKYAEMLKTEPIAAFRERHWAISNNPPEIMKNGVADPELIAALTKGYDRIFKEVGAPEAGRFTISGLSSIPKDSSEARVSGLPAKQIAQIDAWALEMLRLAKEATGEDLEIGSVAVGRGFSAGDGRGPVVHADGTSTYIHALTSLAGPQTLVFPDGRGLSQHIITGKNPDGSLTLISIERDKPGTITVDAPLQPKAGKSIMISGWGYAKAKDGRLPTVHSSPLNTGMDRLTLFIDIRPRAKK